MFLADESIDQRLIRKLHTFGIDVISSQEAGLRGCKDQDYLDYAPSRGQLILTCDHDFGTLVYKNSLATNGIVLIRPGVLTDAQITTVTELVQRIGLVGFESHFSVISLSGVDGIVRRRKLPFTP